MKSSLLRRLSLFHLLTATGGFGGGNKKNVGKKEKENSAVSSFSIHLYNTMQNYNIDIIALPVILNETVNGFILVGKNYAIILELRTV